MGSAVRAPVQSLGTCPLPIALPQPTALQTVPRLEHQAAGAVLAVWVLIGFLVYQHGHLPVDAQGHLDIRPDAKHRAGEGVGVDAGEILRGSRKGPISIDKLARMLLGTRAGKDSWSRFYQR